MPLWAPVCRLCGRLSAGTALSFPAQRFCCSFGFRLDGVGLTQTNYTAAVHAFFNVCRLPGGVTQRTQTKKRLDDLFSSGPYAKWDAWRKATIAHLQRWLNSSSCLRQEVACVDRQCWVTSGFCTRDGQETKGTWNVSAEPESAEWLFQVKLEKLKACNNVGCVFPWCPAALEDQRFEATA